MTDLEAYYNKFNEEKRLDSRHGRVEFVTSMHYIHQCLDEIVKKRAKEEIHILDIGAGTGRYSVPLAQEGFDVTAVELVKHNLGRLKQKGAGVHAYQGNAMNLKKFSDDSFDVTLLFGPMYHLHEEKDKLAALREAVRVTRPGGRILVAYIMNEFSVITYAFKEKHILEALQEGMLTEDYHCTSKANPLYSMVRLEDIEALGTAGRGQAPADHSGRRCSKLYASVFKCADEESLMRFCSIIWQPVNGWILWVQAVTRWIFL